MCSWDVSKKCASFSCKVEYVDYVECFLNLQTLPGAPQKNKKNIFNITTVRNTFFPDVLLSAEMLNMLNVFLDGFRKMFFFSYNVEHVDYVECF